MNSIFVLLLSFFVLLKGNHEKLNNTQATLPCYPCIAIYARKTKEMLVGRDEGKIDFYHPHPLSFTLLKSKKARYFLYNGMLSIDMPEGILRFQKHHAKGDLSYIFGTCQRPTQPCTLDLAGVSTKLIDAEERWVIVASPFIVYALLGMLFFALIPFVGRKKRKMIRQLRPYFPEKERRYIDVTEKEDMPCLCCFWERGCLGCKKKRDYLPRTLFINTPYRSGRPFDCSIVLTLSRKKREKLIDAIGYASVIDKLPLEEDYFICLKEATPPMADDGDFPKIQREKLSLSKNKNGTFSKILPPMEEKESIDGLDTTQALKKNHPLEEEKKWEEDIPLSNQIKKGDEIPSGIDPKIWQRYRAMVSKSRKGCLQFVPGQDENTSRADLQEMLGLSALCKQVGGYIDLLIVQKEESQAKVPTKKKRLCCRKSEAIILEEDSDEA